MAEEEDKLLAKLLAFYKTRYTGIEMETKFNDACLDLIQTDDIKESNYIKFCIDNDVEPVIKKKAKKPSWGTGTSSPSYDPCGHGGRSASHC